mmetsp:Transcript_3647/g.7566  ORF Transcript_3647/g.7566 Transcript_3647/m.7566 type:complete len:259 (-) Transcript_3647:23-799(-)
MQMAIRLNSARQKGALGFANAQQCLTAKLQEEHELQQATCAAGARLKARGAHPRDPRGRPRANRAEALRSGTGQRDVLPQQSLLELGDRRLHIPHHEPDRHHVAAPRVAAQLGDARQELLQIDRASAVYIQCVEQVHLLLVGDVQVPQHLTELGALSELLEHLRRDSDALQILEAHAPQTVRLVLALETSYDVVDEVVRPPLKPFLVHEPLLLPAVLVVLRRCHCVLHEDGNDHVKQAERDEDASETVHRTYMPAVSV